LKRCCWIAALLGLFIAANASAQVYMKAGSPAFIFEEKVNVRDTPSTEGKAVVLLTRGTKVKILEQGKDVVTLYDIPAFWYKVEYKAGASGWVWGGLLADRTATGDVDADGKPEIILMRASNFGHFEESLYAAADLAILDGSTTWTFDVTMAGEGYWNSARVVTAEFGKTLTSFLILSSSFGDGPYGATNERLLAITPDKALIALIDTESYSDDSGPRAEKRSTIEFKKIDGITYIIVIVVEERLDEHGDKAYSVYQMTKYRLSDYWELIEWHDYQAM
jgi:hypothetical protein